MSPEEIQAALSAILAQPVRQSKLLADWVRDCLPTTLILGAAVSAGISFVILIQPGPRLALFVGALIALLPPLILLRWILAIPRIWSISERQVAILLFLGLPIFVVVGHALGGRMLNDLFQESPGFFPVAFAVASYIGAIQAFLLATYVITLVMLLVVPSLLLISHVITSPGRGWHKLGIVGLLGVLIILLRFGITGIDLLTDRILSQTALAADFFPNHRCKKTGWPEDVTRVAFIGDEQVLGYQARGGRFIVLPCPRDRSFR